MSTLLLKCISFSSNVFFRGCTYTRNHPSVRMICWHHSCYVSQQRFRVLQRSMVLTKAGRLQLFTTHGLFTVPDVGHGWRTLCSFALSHWKRASLLRRVCLVSCAPRSVIPARDAAALGSFIDVMIPPVGLDIRGECFSWLSIFIRIRPLIV